MCLKASYPIVVRECSLFWSKVYNTYVTYYFWTVLIHVGATFDFDCPLLYREITHTRTALPWPYENSRTYRFSYNLMSHWEVQQRRAITVATRLCVTNIQGTYSWQVVIHSMMNMERLCVYQGGFNKQFELLQSHACCLIVIKKHKNKSDVLTCWLAHSHSLSLSRLSTV